MITLRKLIAQSFERVPTRSEIPPPRGGVIKVGAVRISVRPDRMGPGVFAWARSSLAPGELMEGYGHDHESAVQALVALALPSGED